MTEFAKKIIELDEFMKDYEKFKLNEIDLLTIEAHLRCLQNEDTRRLSHNYIIVGEGKEPEALAENIAKSICSILENKKVITTVSEKKLIEDGDTVTDFSECDCLIINNCMSKEKYERETFTSMSAAEAVEKRNEVWQDAMDAFLRFPAKVVFLCTDKDTYEERFKNWNYMTEIAFPYHIELPASDNEKILMFCIQRLCDFRFEDEFQNGLREYIANVYPQSKLRGDDFAKHLCSEIVFNYYKDERSKKSLSADCLPTYEKINSVDEILNRLDRYVGLNKAKEEISNLLYIGEEIKETGEYPFLNFVFKGEPGTGKTSIAQEMANLLYATGVIKRNNVYEVTASDLLAPYVGQTGKLTRNICRKAYGGVLFIDEAYSLNPYNDGSETDSFKYDCIAELVNEMSCQKENLCIIFAGYPNQMDDFINSNPGLRSRIGYTIDFDEYDVEELVEIFCRCADRKGYKVDVAALERVRKAVIAEKYNENFANARSIENLLFRSQIECRKKNPGTKTLLQEHIVIEKEQQNFNQLLSELESKPGLDEAKKILKELINTCKFYQDNHIDGFEKHNMLFVGSPGTGKSMTAELFGKMLFEASLAKSPKFISISAGNLLCEKRGALLDYCEKAKGGILFIDEIYMLNSNRIILGEVISILLDVLENNTYDLSVILAGYENEIKQFLSCNKGLASRFDITIHFDDYTEDELCDIFEKLCIEKGFKLSSKAHETMRRNIELEMKKNDFANARDIRILFDNVIRRHATNYYSLSNYEDAKLLTESDFDNVYKCRAYSNSNIVGFVKG